MTYDKEQKRKYARKYRRKLVKWAIDALGRKCKCCGYTDICDCDFDFHHYEHEDSWNEKGDKFKFLREYRKNGKIPNNVILLCAICHRRVHRGYISVYATGNKKEDGTFEIKNYVFERLNPCELE